MNESQKPNPAEEPKPAQTKNLARSNRNPEEQAESQSPEPEATPEPAEASQALGLAGAAAPHATLAGAALDATWTSQDSLQGGAL